MRDKRSEERLFREKVCVDVRLDVKRNYYFVGKGMPIIYSNTTC